MDHHVFDTVTRLFGASGSRRTAWRAMLAGALIGVTTRSADATPRCANGKRACGPSGACCPGKCFTNRFCEVCCTGNNVICHTSGGPVCCLNADKNTDPCKSCAPPELGYLCQDAITGSYRRR